MRPLNIRLRWQFRLARDLDLGLMCREHEESFQAIAAHDPARAAALAFHHAASNRAKTVAAFREQGWAAEPAPLDTRRGGRSSRARRGQS